jgi:acetyltransferase-like isoleucine patch superfamily enzyme
MSKMERAFGILNDDGLVTFLFSVKNFFHNYIINKHLGIVGEVLYKSRNKRRYDSYRQKYKIEDSFSFSGPETTLTGDGEIELDESSYIGHNSHLHACEGCHIRIGKNCPMSEFIKIYVQDRIDDQDLKGNTEKSSGDVEIKDNCWIGTLVFITRGTTIGENTGLRLIA